MNLIFHDRSASPASQGIAYLTIERGGNFSLNAAATQLLKLKVGAALLLVQDKDTNQWYIYLGTQPGTQPFLLRLRDGRKTSAMLFGSTSKAREYFAAHQLDAQQVTSVRLRIDKAQQQQGLSLYPLVDPHRATAKPAPAKAAAKTTAPELDPEAQAVARVRRQVQELGSLELRKVAEPTLTRALGLLTQYPDLLPTVPGATRLLEKLEAHFSPAQ